MALVYANASWPWTLCKKQRNRQLMQIYTGMGDRTAALRQYETCTQLLKTELGLTPSADITALWDEIRNGYQSQRLRPTSPRPTAAPSLSHNLPTPPTPFVGRRIELAEIEHLLMTPEARLATLIGPGATGLADGAGGRGREPQHLCRRPSIGVVGNAGGRATHFGIGPVARGGASGSSHPGNRHCPGPNLVGAE